MIGKVLWNEFFTNRDWPLASAVAVVLLVVLVVPIVLLPARAGRGGSGGDEPARRPASSSRWSLGFAFLYLPILLLIVYSFNASRLVTVWGGFSTQWYGALLAQRAAARRRLADAARRLSSRPAVARCSARWRRSRWRATARFRGRTLFSGMVLRAAGHARGDHRACRCCCCSSPAAVERGFWTVTIAHATFSLGFVAVVVQSRLAGFDRSLEEAAQDLGATPLVDLLRR